MFICDQEGGWHDMVDAWSLAVDQTLTDLESGGSGQGPVGSRYASLNNGMCELAREGNCSHRGVNRIWPTVEC